MRALTVIQEEDLILLGEKAALQLLKQCRELLEQYKEIVISVPGGRSVQMLFRALVPRMNFLTEDEWSRIHIFWSDERLVPPTHQDSNYRLLKELFLDKAVAKKLLPAENIHRFPGEKRNVKRELLAYEKELYDVSEGHIHIPILGVGKDGHVAALFPNHKMLTHEKEEFLLIEDSPNPPTERVTISPKHIAKSDAPFLLFLSDKKQEALDCFFDKKANTEDCPSKLAWSGEKDSPLYVITDRVLRKRI